jgi:DNA-binding GntR family transcriptional regulator
MFERKTVAHFIYESLRKDIIEFRFKPGEKLSEVKLAQKYRVSRSPIRDAIHKLRHENLVLVKPQIGTIVSSVSLSKARDICQVRLLLEPYAAEVSVERISDEDQTLLAFKFKRLVRMKNHSERKKRMIFEFDTLLHNTILRLCANEEISSIIEGYRDEINRIRMTTTTFADRLIPSLVEMGSIYEALMKREGKAAHNAMHIHMLNLMNAVEGLESVSCSSPLLEGL